MAGVSTMDIARKLGLSRNTISKALNDSSEVTPKTKKLIIETAIEMGYKRISRKEFYESREPEMNRDICLLVHEREMEIRYWNKILRGVEEYLTARKYRIVLAILTEAEAETDRLPPTLENSKVAGIITVGNYSEEYYRRLKATGIPLVTIDTAATIKSSHLLCDTIMTCNHSTVYDITEHLIQNGFKKIVFAGNPNGCRSVRERWNGYREAMLTYGLEISEEYRLFRDIDIKAMESLEGYFEEPLDLPEALVCANDDIANKIWVALKAKGIRLPGDLAISGFDNYDTGAEEPNLLTSVDYNISELGKLAARQVIYRIHNPEASFVLVRLAANVLFRQSTERTKIKSYK